MFSHFSPGGESTTIAVAEAAVRLESREALLAVLAAADQRTLTIRADVTSSSVDAAQLPVFAAAGHAGGAGLAFGADFSDRIICVLIAGRWLRIELWSTPRSDVRLNGIGPKREVRRVGATTSAG